MAWGIDGVAIDGVVVPSPVLVVGRGDPRGMTSPLGVAMASRGTRRSHVCGVARMYIFGSGG